MNVLDRFPVASLAAIETVVIGVLMAIGLSADLAAETVTVVFGAVQVIVVAVANAIKHRRVAPVAKHQRGF